MTSLGQSPALSSRPRPTAPGRSKRQSLTPTLRANIALGPPSPRRPHASGEKLSASGGAGLMGGLRERSESEVKRAGREELVGALQGEWEARDRITEHVDALESERRKLEKEREELGHSLAGLQARVDEAFNEQSRLEADLEGRDELLDKMRGRILESEKFLRDGQKRYAEQERSFEAEREAFRAQELHLQTRIKHLSNIPATTGKSASPITNENMELLQEELASLSASHCTLIAQLNTVSSELGDLKGRNKVLEEENAGWELLMRERTLNGGMRGKGLLGEEWLEEGEGEDGLGEDAARGQSESEALDKEMEGLMDCGISHSPPEAKGGFGRKQRKGENLGDLQVSGSGLDLAAELGRAEVLDGGDMRVLGKGDEGEALRAEVKQLRESNKALSLYCSKIIDRIIAQEGFEHVLAVDYKTRRLNTQRARLGQGGGRTSVHDIVRNMQGAGDVPPPVPALPSTIPTRIVSDTVEVTPAPAAKKPRPMSMMARAFSGASATSVEETVASAPAPVSVPAPISAVQAMKDEEAKAAKKAKRGFSIDFRSFGFGSAPVPTPSPPTEPKGLKPLQLPRRTASTSRPASVRIPSPPMFSPPDYPGIPVARKLDPQAEDEEDRRERHRMEAAMRLMGIDRTSLSPSGTIAEEIEPDMSAPRAGGRSSTGSSSSLSPTSRTTPLSRLSSRLVSTFSPTLENAAMVEDVPEQSTSAAIAAFDKKEQQQAKAVGKNNYQTGFTCPSSPSSGSIRDRRASMRRGSAQSSDGAGRAMRKGGISKSESISTLWSAGSESRRGSVEVRNDVLEVV